MPHLHHTFTLTALDRGDVARTVSSAYGVVRGARFGPDGALLPPTEEELRRLERRAEARGIVPDAEERAAYQRAFEDPPGHAEGSGEAVPEGDDRGSAERELDGHDLAEEAALREARLSLRLLSGEHLAPGSAYLVTEVDAEGRPVFETDGDGWVGTDLTVTSWNESGRCAVDFAMREDAGAADGASPRGESTTTTGTVVHDHVQETLTVEADLRLPVESAMARWGSGLLRARVRVRVDLPGWYAAASGAATVPPVTLEVEHRLVRASGEAVPAPGPEGVWSVSGRLEVRGVGLSRPLVAAAGWALGRSLRGSDAWSLEARAAAFEAGWDGIARALPEFPALLDELAAVLADARPQ
ncbi:hypothetical protein [Nocardiopsis sp. NPDC006938]|uniref:hypothetical protein n=1 Tax=Nocardiopsis sp. NPDC006938 TaxID=3364337 RepID=UPI00368C3819